MKSVVPATSSLLSRLPACVLGGLLLTRPTSRAGATPMLPKNGFSGTTMPGLNSEVMAFRSSFRIRAAHGDPIIMEVMREQNWELIPGAESMEGFAARV